jgi:polyisoprenoid-binding protein YceI
MTTYTLAEQTIAGAWQLDPARSSVEFRVPSFWGLVTVKGRFEDYRGRLDVSAEPAIELTIEAASIDTGNARRDEHLRSRAFFDAESHPQVRFASDAVVVDGETLKVRGHLSARGQSIPLELEARLQRLDGGFAIDAATQAPHRELGMNFSPLGVVSPRSELRVSGFLQAAA